MAKKSAVENNKNKMAKVKQFAARRAQAESRRYGSFSAPVEEQFEARLKLAELPRNSAKIRIRNRCESLGASALLLSQDAHVPHRVA